MVHVSMLGILRAADRIRPHAVKTPLILLEEFSERFGSEVRCKLESQQVTGSFKFRGALNNILSLTPEEREQGLVAASSGNHARAVSYISQMTGTSAVVCVPTYTTEQKKEGILRYGATLRVVGESYGAAEEEAKQIEQNEHRRFIYSSEDPETIAGQGTIALEILEARPDIEVILAPAGGGGLMCGAAIAAKTLNPAIKVYGVQSVASTAWHASFQNKKLVNDVPFLPTYAEGLAGEISGSNVELALQWIDDILLVEEKSILRAMRWMAKYNHCMIEGSAAVTLAAIMEGNHHILKGKKIAAIISGGNVSLETFREALSLDVDE